MAELKEGDPVVAGILARYRAVHPLVRHRSLARARTPGELFDLLDGFPSAMPVVWDPQERRWKTTNLLQTRKTEMPV